MKKTIVGSVIMKKIIFLLLLFIGAFAFSNEYSEKEKNTILTQFVEFQKDTAHVMRNQKIRASF